MSNIEAIITLQAGLMDAIDARDVGQIEAKARDLSCALGQIRNRGAMAVGEKQMTDVGYALKQTEALRTRVNFLALRNREMIERLDQVRGASTPYFSENPANMGVSSLQN